MATSTTAPPEPLGRRGPALPLLVLPAAAFVTVTAEALPVGLLRQMADGLGASPSRIGLLVGWFAVVAGATPVLLTRLTRRLDRRTVAVATLVLFATGCAVSAAATSFAVVFLARAALAMSHALLFTVGTLMLVRLAPPRRKGTAAGAMVVGASSAFVVGVPVTTWFGQVAGWRQAHLLVGAVALVLAAAVLVVLPPMPPETGHGERDVGLRALLTSRPLLAVLAVTSLLVLAHFSVFTFLSPLLEDEVGVPARRLGLVFAVFGVAGVVGSAFGGRLAQRHPRAVALSCAAVLLAAYVVLRVGASVPALVVGTVAVWGATFSVVAVSQQLAVLRLAGSGPNGETAAALQGAVFQAAIAAGSGVGSAFVGGVRWGQLSGIGAVAGIGFTIALFVTGLAFDDPTLQQQAKIGILAGSALAALLALGIFRFLSARGALCLPQDAALSLPPVQDLPDPE